MSGLDFHQPFSFEAQEPQPRNAAMEHCGCGFFTRCFHHVFGRVPEASRAASGPSSATSLRFPYQAPPLVTPGSGHGYRAQQLQSQQTAQQQQQQQPPQQLQQQHRRNEITPEPERGRLLPKAAVSSAPVSPQPPSNVAGSGLAGARAAVTQRAVTSDANTLGIVDQQGLRHSKSHDKLTTKGKGLQGSSSALSEACSMQAVTPSVLMATEQDEDDDFCPTCLDNYTTDNPKIWTECGHHFHMPCIYEWLERSSKCPYCASAMRFPELDGA